MDNPYRKKIAELEKENADLKKELKKLRGGDSEKPAKGRYMDREATSEKES
jgi:cell division protein FtsB